MKKGLIAILCCLLGLSVFSQIELQKKGDGFVLILEKGNRALVSFPLMDFVTTDKGPHSTITNHDEIEHHWVVRGHLFSGNDSVSFIAGFYKLSQKDTVIFTMSLSDPKITSATLKFYYQDTTGVYKPVAKGKRKNLKGSSSFVYGPGTKSYTGNLYYTNDGYGILIENNATTSYDFSNPEFLTIRVESLPIKGRIFFPHKD